MTLNFPLQAVNLFFEAWLFSSPPLPTQQANMVSTLVTRILYLFGRHHSKSRIFQSVGSFQNVCCALRLKNDRFKN